MSTPPVTPPPIRKSHDIPQEIINKIIDDVSQLDSKYHLLACSLVSRAFRYPSRGHLFSTTELDVYPTPLGSKKLLSQARNNMESRLRALIDLLAYPSDLGAAIRTLKIANHNFDEATLNELLGLCITRAPHLTTLYLASFHWRSLGADVSKSLIALITRRSVSVLDLSNITNMPRDTMDRCPSLRFLRMNYVTFATSSSASDVGWALAPTMADYLSLSGTYRFIQNPNSAAHISLSYIMLTLESQSHVAKFVSLVSATATTYLRSLKLAFPPNVRIDIADGITLGDFRCLSSIWLEMHWDNKLTGIEAFLTAQCLLHWNISKSSSKHPTMGAPRGFWKPSMSPRIPHASSGVVSIHVSSM
ncbi:hypothetical protein CPB84DRAFT_315682 [Gymnopilus junonius]|uniref:F-box domain-containing protein n=1 Tax=Gymnopilus junonius TaxID=109634 RepID=A0A9P5TI59_GYMJU|nr:hypothetical protein CPB84DRAFT_315682 [Gymnopilus junonius]